MSLIKKPSEVRLETFAEVVELAAFTQRQLDLIDDEIEAGELKEVVSVMDKVSAGPLAGQEMAIAGIFKRYDPDPESAAGFTSSLEDSLIQGISNGFAIKHLEEFEPEFGSIEEGEVFDKLRKRAMGSYLVCHMLTHRVEPGTTEDMGVLLDMKYQAFAPIVASDVHLYGEHESSLSQTTAEDVRLVYSVDKPSRRSLARILEVMDSTDDTLTVLRSAAPYANKIMNRNKAPVRKALLRTLFNWNAIGTENYRYRFDEFPPVLVDTEDRQTISLLNKELLGDVYVVGLTVDRKYYVDGQGGLIIPDKASFGLYVNVAAPISPDHTDRFAIPLHLVKTGSYRCA